MTAVATTPRGDPALSEILRGCYESIVEEVDQLIERGAVGMVIREGRDYCAVVADADGQVLAVGQKDLPAFVGTIAFSIRGVIEWIGAEAMRPGDVYIMNCPWVGGTHYNDVRLVAPVFSGDTLIGYVGAAGHVTDIGGVNPGSFNISAPNAYAEGLRIVPCLFYREGELNADVWKLILANVRHGDTTEGDLRALLAAVQRAERRLIEVSDTHGEQALLQWMGEYQDYGRERTREMIAALPNGRYRFTDHIDADPTTGKPLRLVLSLEVTDERLVFDFEGTDPQAQGATNSSLPSTAAVVYVAVASMFPELPFNQGMIDCLELVAPEGSVVNCTFPAPVSGMAATTFDITTACVMGAFAQVAPERAMAASYNLQAFITSGHDDRHDREFVTYSWGPGGWGAHADGDGRVAVALYCTTSVVIPIEAEERRVPFVIEEYAIRPDSGGAGRWRGGNCLARVFRFDYHGRVTSLAGRGKFPIWGLFEGLPGAPQYALLERDGEARDIGLLADNVPVRPGDRLIFVNGGGGGFGPPTEREPERVLEDVLDGWVTPETAGSIYGVVLNEVPDTSVSTTFEIDWEATSTTRSKSVMDRSLDRGSWEGARAAGAAPGRSPARRRA